MIFIERPADPSDPTRRVDFWTDTLKTPYPQGLNNIDPYHQLFIAFAVLLVSTAFPFSFFFFKSTGYFYVHLICYASFVQAGYYVTPLRRSFLVPPRSVTGLLVLLLLFISSYYLGHVRTYLFLLTLVQSCRKLKLCKRLFVDCLYYNVTELF